MVDGNDDGVGNGPPGPPAPPEPQARQPGDPGGQPAARRPDADDQPTMRQPGVRPPQGTAPQHRASVLRQPTIGVEPALIQAAPGATSELTLTITNNSDTVSDFAVSLDDPSVGWIQVEPASKNLWPGTRDVFRVIVQPPRSAEVRAGRRQYGLTVRSSGIPGGTATAAVAVEVLPFEAIEARLVPRTSAGYTRGKHRIELRNNGSAPWTANVAGVDPEDVLRLKVPTQVMANPSETLNVPIEARPKSLAFVGSTSRHPFSVTLAGPSGVPIALDGTYTQRAFIPKPVIPAVAAVAVAAVVLFATGILPPKPAPTPAPSAPPSVVPTDAPTDVPSAPPSDVPTDSAPPSASEPASLDPSVPPEGVAQWAWDRRNEQLAQGNPFDPGEAIGPTSLTNDSMAEMQLWTNATMYRIVGSQDALTIRAPILERFRDPGEDPKAPSIGLPKGNRQNDGNNRFTQAFTVTGIACSDNGCFKLVNPIYDLWFKWREQLGYPLNDAFAISTPGEQLVASLDSGWVILDTGTNATAVCDADRNFLDGTDSTLCSVPVGP